MQTIQSQLNILAKCAGELHNKIEENSLKISNIETHKIQ